MISGAAIYRKPTPEELELARLKDLLTRMRDELTARESALDGLRSQLFSFEGRYIRQVGLLYKQLDEWEQRIAELHVAAPTEGSTEDERDEDFCPPAEPSSAPPIDLRALYRELAKRIHPDFAMDAHDEHRRTRLMAQANDALRRKDRGVLERMLNGFDPSTETTGSLALEVEIANTRAVLQQIEHDIQTALAEADELRNSELARLQQRTVEAAAAGRDLLAEMAARVKGRIGLTMRQYELDLDRKKRPPAGPSVESLVTAETHCEPRYDPKRRSWMKQS